MKNLNLSASLKGKYFSCAVFFAADKAMKMTAPNVQEYYTSLKIVHCAVENVRFCYIRATK